MVGIWQMKYTTQNQGCREETHNPTPKHISCKPMWNEIASTDRIHALESILISKVNYWAGAGEARNKGHIFWHVGIEILYTHLIQQLECIDLRVISRLDVIWLRRNWLQNFQRNYDSPLTSQIHTWWIWRGHCRGCPRNWISDKGRHNWSSHKIADETTIYIPWVRDIVKPIKAWNETYLTCLHAWGLFEKSNFSQTTA